MSRKPKNWTLPQPSNYIRPLTSPSYDEVPVRNILPSYQLYESTVSMNVDPSREDMRGTPPGYSPETQADYFGNYQSSPSNDTSQSIPPIVNDPSAQGYNVPTRWENSLLANTHRLKRINEIDAKLQSNLRVEIHLTDTRDGAEISNPLDYEYQQGEEINGYVLVENMSSENIDFDMFSVVFEGRLTVNGEGVEKKPVVFYKFLNMFDYHASWTPADLYKKQISADIDPIDGTHLRLNVNKIFEPGVVYKKFFDFTIPERLLDCACEAHAVKAHGQLCPSIGLVKEQFLQSVRKLRQKGPLSPTSEVPGAKSSAKSSGPKSPGSKSPTSVFPLSPLSSKSSLDHPRPRTERFKDLCFPDSYTCYGVEVRVVGRASQFDKRTAQDEFVIMEQESCFVRLVPRSGDDYAYDDNQLEAESMYSTLVDRVNSKLESGRDLLNSCQNSTELVRKLSITKKKQLYTSESKPKLKRRNLEEYKVTVPLKRKLKITSNFKYAGSFEMTSPRMKYQVQYHLPIMNYLPNGKLNIPIELFFKSASNDIKPPEIKGILVEVLVFTFRSKKYTMPVELTPEMIFKNTSVPNDNYEHNVGQIFKGYLDELTYLIHQTLMQQLNVDSQLIMDVRAMADLGCKYHHIKVNDLQIKTDKGLLHWEKDTLVQDGQYIKTIDIFTDINSIFKEKTQEVFTLVPSFQSCFLGRMYFLNISVKLQNHDPVYMKIPFDIVHR